MSDSLNSRNRNVGLDLLKVVMMFLIVVFHFSDHGNIKITSQMPLTFNWMILAIARIFGAIGNCVFMFISGYFLCEKNFRMKRLVVLWLQVFFFSVICRSITIVSGIDTFEGKILIKTILPVTYQRYWYFSAYVIILIASPFINIIMKKLTQKQHFWLCIILMTIFAVVPTIAKGTWLGGSIGNENYLKVFITLYVTAGYIRFYGIKFIQKNSVYLWITLGIMVLEVLSILFIRFVNILFDKNLSLYHFTWGMDRINIVIASISLFMWFKGINLKENKFIASLSSASFGVYLLHVGTWKLCFNVLFNNSATYDTPWMVFQMLGSALLIYSAAVVVDKIRVALVEKPFIKIFDKLKWPKRIDTLYGNLIGTNSAI